ncbi:unnamed protein product [Urochloa humidicola]
MEDTSAAASGAPVVGMENAGAGRAVTTTTKTVEVVAAVDASEESLQVLSWALDNVVRCHPDAALVVVHAHHAVDHFVYPHRRTRPSVHAVVGGGVHAEGAGGELLEDPGSHARHVQGAAGGRHGGRRRGRRQGGHLPGRRAVPSRAPRPRQSGPWQNQK